MVAQSKQDWFMSAGTSKLTISFHSLFLLPSSSELLPVQNNLYTNSKIQTESVI